MKRPHLLLVVAMLLSLSACGVSSTQKATATSDFLSKMSALYLRLGVPAVVESAELDDFEKGDYMGCGSLHASFSMKLATDEGSVVVLGDAAFDSDGRLVMDSDSTFAVFPILLRGEHGLLSVSDSPYLIKEIHR